MTALRRLVVWLLWPFVYEGQSLRPFGADGFVSAVDCDPDDTPSYEKGKA